MGYECTIEDDKQLLASIIEHTPYIYPSNSSTYREKMLLLIHSLNKRNPQAGWFSERLRKRVDHIIGPRGKKYIESGALDPQKAVRGKVWARLLEEIKTQRSMVDHKTITKEKILAKAILEELNVIQEPIQVLRSPPETNGEPKQFDYLGIHSYSTALGCESKQIGTPRLELGREVTPSIGLPNKESSTIKFDLGHSSRFAFKENPFQFSGEYEIKEEADHHFLVLIDQLMEMNQRQAYQHSEVSRALMKQNELLQEQNLKCFDQLAAIFREASQSKIKRRRME
ncbi:hypothetical protein BABINDRAFT_166054 [Babjeviella inositovora NRRL Y-12698]|uniref:Uncharacterized protein n=1 Tax=Babjeviella inositovora NRRL Y-12698 TaxID=984486 RepID=A0A1E3QUY1_9ASCO|nr:uncharacterized protein BABINDRAFT_166054 [Babjeviella inositovora NRRL Y-12698]ODQ81374.1 hypothetical protein BABINDRAFT_166054 [Babjeviella inositovora NRRL Y-12698]